MTHFDIDALNQQFDSAVPEEILQYLIKFHKKQFCLASSLGAEDQVLTDMICKLSDDVSIFVLDTGRLHQETYNLIDLTMEKYAFSYDIYFPNYVDVESMVKEKGMNLFFESVENRQRCCYVRKVEPLLRALDGFDAWVTGMRRAQSIDRASIQVFEWDQAHNMIKVNPLAKWSKDDVWNYIKRYDVPYNDLHDKGFTSIGCEPCTRPIQSGEDARSGRWWWEVSDKKECGLHVSSASEVSSIINLKKGKNNEGGK